MEPGPRQAPTVDTDGLLEWLQSTNLEYGIGTTLDERQRPLGIGQGARHPGLDEECRFAPLELD